MYFVTYGLFYSVMMFWGLHLSKVNSTSVKIGLTLAAFVVFGYVGWSKMPTLAWDFYGNWLILFIGGVCAPFISLMINHKPPLVVWVPAVVGIVMVAVVPFATSASIFHARDYQEIIGEPVTSQFADDVSPIDTRQIRRVDQALARRLGEKRLGEVPGLGSRVDLGTMNIFTVDGCFDILNGNDKIYPICFEDELVWAGPLVHSGFWKWVANDSTPGYIMVSATDPSEAHLVTALGGATEEAEGVSVARMGTEAEPEEFAQLKMRYFFDGGFWGEYALRHLRTNGFMSDGLTDFSFELNDEGRPYWVVTLFTKRVGYHGADAIGVVTIDIQDGAIQKYSLDEAPEWIDRIQPWGLVTAQLDNWGIYVNGWLNAKFAKTDVVQTTSGMSLVYGADGRSYWYTGIQSAGADQATTGFVLVDTRTKEFRWYQISGAKETAAMASAENAPGVREAQYQATSPILYNVGGVPTYFMTLKGGDGLVKMNAFVSVQNYETFGIGDNIPETLRNYRDALTRQGQGMVIDDLAQRQRVEALVGGIAVEDGFYYLLLDGREGDEFIGSSAISPELKWTNEGDRVVVEFDEGLENPISIARFDNLGVGIADID